MELAGLMCFCRWGTEGRFFVVGETKGVWRRDKGESFCGLWGQTLDLVFFLKKGLFENKTCIDHFEENALLSPNFPRPRKVRFLRSCYAFGFREVGFIMHTWKTLKG